MSRQGFGRVGKRSAAGFVILDAPYVLDIVAFTLWSFSAWWTPAVALLAGIGAATLSHGSDPTDGTGTTPTRGNVRRRTATDAGRRFGRLDRLLGRVRGGPTRYRRTSSHRRGERDSDRTSTAVGTVTAGVSRRRFAASTARTRDARTSRTRSPASGDGRRPITGGVEGNNSEPGMRAGTVPATAERPSVETRSRRCHRRERVRTPPGLPLLRLQAETLIGRTPSVQSESVIDRRVLGTENETSAKKASGILPMRTQSRDVDRTGGWIGRLIAATSGDGEA